MKLRDYIDKKGLPLREFADEIGVAYYTLQRYLAGSRAPGIRELVAIKKATGGAVQAEDFLEKKAR